MKKPATLLLLFYLGHLQLPVFSQAVASYKFESISIKDGLSQSSPNCILQDSRGLLWIGTEDGLNKYDGYEFTVYKPEQDNERSLSNSRIKCLTEDIDGNIWIGTNGSGLDMYSRQYDNFIHFGSPDTNLAQTGVITSLKYDGGNVLIGTMTGFFIYNLKNKSFVSFFNDYEVNSISNDVITCIVKDKPGFFFIGTEEGLNYFDSQTKIFTKYFHEEGNEYSLSDNLIKSVFIDHQNIIWVGTGKGIDIFDKANNRFEHINMPENRELGMKNYTINDIEEDNNGNLWIATNGGGVDIYYKNVDQFINLQYKPNIPFNLSTNEILSLYRDESGIMWVGSNGLDKYNSKKEKFSLYDHDPFSNDNIIYRHIHTIFEDSEKTLWIGSKSDGIHILNRTGKESLRIKSQEDNQDGLSSNKIRVIKEFPKGTIWVGTDDNGLNKIELDNNRKPARFTSFTNNPLKSSTLSSNTVYSLFFDNDGNLWIGTDYGVSKMNPETGDIIRYVPDPDDPKALNNEIAYYIYGDSKSRIWIATDMGLNKYNPENNSFDHFLYEENNTNSLSSNEILTVNEDRNGILWIGTYSHGINSFNTETNKFDRFEEIPVLNTSVVYGILEDNLGFLWLSTNNGIFKFDPLKRTFKQFSIEDGLQSNEFNGGSYFKSTSGEMFFGGQYGFNAFFPDKVNIDTTTPKIILTELKVNNKVITPGEDSPIKKHISEVDEIVFNYSQNNFSITFAALHYANAANNKYKYKLEGFDKDWIENGTQRFVSYTRLPYKTFTFRVKASNSDGQWNETGLSVKIKVKPPFWGTIWFKFLIFILIILIAWYILRNRMHNEEKQKEKLKKEIEKNALELEKARIQLETQKEEITLQKQEIRLREKEQQDVMWFNEGLNKFSDMMSKNRGNTQRLLQIIISELVKYVDAEQGGIYVVNDDIEGEEYLDLTASYAYPAERAGCRFMIGEGYVGTSYKEKKVIEIDNLEKKYTKIKSGLGEDMPKYLAVIPLKLDETVSGIIELASFRKLKGYKIAFIQKMAESLTSMISSEKATEKMMKLVEQSRIQAEELSAQEEELRQSLEEMMATQEESSRREEELVKQAEEFASQEVLLQEEIEKIKNENKELKEIIKNNKN